jgi:alanine dehydrogenase
LFVERLSYALSNVLAPLLLKLTEAKDLADFLYYNVGARNGMYIYKGHLTNKYLGKRLNIYHKEIDLLLAAHM